MLAGFGGALEALRAADAVSTAEVSDWSNRMHIALGLEPLEPSPPGVTRAVFIGEGDPPAPIVPRASARFLGLIPAEDADRPIPYGGRIQILGVERYDTKVAVAWRLTPLPDLESQFASELQAHDRDIEGLPDLERKMSRHRFLSRLHHPGLELALTDDLGTEYHGGGGGSGGGRDERVGRSEFWPAIPSHASLLSVHWGDAVFRVPLT